MTDTKYNVKTVRGRIIKVNKKEGWGFIASKEIEFTRIFFHWTALQQNTLGFKEIRTGMECEFTPIQIPDKGYRAIRVKIVEREREKSNEEPNVSTLSE